MEVIKKAQFVTDFYGGKPYLPGTEVVKDWLESQQDRLLNPRMKELKDALGNEVELEKILSVFNANGNNEPIIGNWMLLECGMNAAKLANTWTRFQVSADIWRENVFFSPGQVLLFRNGQLIEEPEGVEAYTVTTKRVKPVRSFFKAYQLIEVEASFEFVCEYPEDLCTKIEGSGKSKQILPDPERSLECVDAVLDKMCLVGLGAYRLRFGKFKYN